MIPTRKTQPYRKGRRSPGAALRAMLLGKPMYSSNPADFTRAIQRMNRKR